MHLKLQLYYNHTLHCHWSAILSRPHEAMRFESGTMQPGHQNIGVALQFETAVEGGRLQRNPHGRAFF